MGFDFDDSVLQHILRSPAGAVGRDIERRAGLVAADARSRAPGSMPQYIPAPEMGHTGVEVSAVVSCNHPAAHFVLRGTGLYGPTGQRIRPVRAQALRFVLNGRVVFAKSVKGQKPNDFLSKALPAAI